jgi:glycosyltransferase
MKISIITCVFNRVTTIAGALDSVRVQTHANVEHIIIDGGSTDGTLEMIEKHAHERMRVRSKPDDGIYDALNKGVELATGEIIGLVHSDDWLAHDEVIAKVAAAFRGGAHAVYGDLQYVSARDPAKVVRHWKAGVFNRDALHRGWMPPHPALFLRRTDLIAAGFYNTDYRISADYDLILKIFMTPGFRPAYIPDVFVKMRLGGVSNGSLRQVFRKSAEDYRILRSNGVGGGMSLVAKNIRKLTQFRPWAV